MPTGPSKFIPDEPSIEQLRGTEIRKVKKLIKQAQQAGRIDEVLSLKAQLQAMEDF